MTADRPAPIGRQALLDGAIARVLGGARPLVLVGLPGVGKSHLARAIVTASALADRGPVFTCSLDRARDAAAVDTELGWAFGIDPSAPLDASRERVGRALAAASTPILLLDGIDHVADAVCAAVSRWRTLAPGLRLILTARRPVPLDDADHLTVPPLPDADAVALFVENVRRFVPGFPASHVTPEAIARAISPLDGLPFALELAASWMQVLTLDELGRYVADDPLGWLGADAPRGRSIGRLLEWSWRALPAEARRVALHASVFRGTFTRRAVAGVMGLDVDRAALDITHALRILVEHGLVTPSRSGPSRRFRMGALIRAFAETAWRPGARARAVARHATWFSGSVDDVVDGVLWFNAAAGRVPRADLPDILAAVRHILPAGGAAAARIVLTAHRAVLDHGPRHHHEMAMDAVIAGPTVPRRWRLLTRLARAQARWQWRDTAGALAAFDRLIVDADGEGDVRAVAAMWGAFCAALSGDSDGAARRLEAVSADALPPRPVARAEWLHHQAMDRLFAWDLDRARSLLAAGLAAADQAGFDGLRYAFRMNLGYLALETDALDAALVHRREALAAARRLDVPRDRAAALLGVSVVSLKSMRLDEARAWAEEARALTARIDEPRGQARAIHLLGHVHLAAGQSDAARPLLATADQILAAVGEPRGAVLARATLALLDLLDGRPGAAIEPLRAAAALLARSRDDGRAEWNHRLADLAAGLVALDHAPEDGQRPPAHSERPSRPLPSRLAFAERCIDVAHALVEAPDEDVRARAAALLADRAGGTRIESHTGVLVLAATLDAVDARHGSGSTLRVRTDGRAFRVADGPLVDLTRRRQPARLLAALADHRRRQPGRPLSVQALFSAGWPGDEAMTRAVHQRVHTAIYTLRKAGLGEVLQRHEKGYRVDPAVRVVITHALV